MLFLLVWYAWHSMILLTYFQWIQELSKRAFPRWCYLWILFTYNVYAGSFHSSSLWLEWLCALAAHPLMTLCCTVPALDTFYEYYNDFQFSFFVDTGRLLPRPLILPLNSSFWPVSLTTLTHSCTLALNEKKKTLRSSCFTLKFSSNF